MTQPLRAKSGRLPESTWQLKREEPEVIREWAKVPCVPNDKDYRKNQLEAAVTSFAGWFRTENQC
jgi:hypothetical protein